MACKKYVLTNNTESTQTFSYQECSNNMWIYDVLLEPGQTKTIWFVNSTFQSYYTNSITLVDDGAFPPTPSASAIAPSPTPTPSATVTPTPTISLTPSITPTISVTPSITPSITPSTSVTPSVTATQTPTPSITPTNTITPTITPSQTPTFNFVVSNTNTGGAYVQGVTGTTGTVITKSGYSYPVNSGETLYSDFTNSGGNLQFDVEIKDPSSADFQLIIKTNGSITDTFTPGPGDFTANVGPYTVIDSDVIQVILENI
jgi:hypothetical protein